MKAEACRLHAQLFHRNGFTGLFVPAGVQPHANMHKHLRWQGAGDASRYTSRLDQRSSPRLPLSSATNKPVGFAGPLAQKPSRGVRGASLVKGLAMGK
jgi:hypothetical protein